MSGFSKACYENSFRSFHVVQVLGWHPPPPALRIEAVRDRSSKLGESWKLVRDIGCPWLLDRETKSTGWQVCIIRLKES